MRFRETWVEQKRIERAFREKENADAGDDRKIMFGLAQMNETSVEARQPSFIKKATLFTSAEEQFAINRLEKESKEMARELGITAGEELDQEHQEQNEAKEINPKNKRSSIG